MISHSQTTAMLRSMPYSRRAVMWNPAVDQNHRRSSATSAVLSFEVRQRVAVVFSSRSNKFS